MRWQQATRWQRRVSPCRVSCAPLAPRRALQSGTTPAWLRCAASASARHAVAGGPRGGLGDPSRNHGWLSYRTVAAQNIISTDVGRRLPRRPRAGRSIRHVRGWQQLAVQRDATGHAGGGRRGRAAGRRDRGAAHHLLLLCRVHGVCAAVGVRPVGPHLRGGLPAAAQGRPALGKTLGAGRQPPCWVSHAFRALLGAHPGQGPAASYCRPLAPRSVSWPT